MNVPANVPSHRPEWFQILPTQTAVGKTSDVEYQSLTSLQNNTPVEFYKLFFSFRIKRVNGTNCDHGDIVAPINDIFNGLLGNVELFMNDRLISHSNNTHSMITHLIHDSESSF